MSNEQKKLLTLLETLEDLYRVQGENLENHGLLGDAQMHEGFSKGLKLAKSYIENPGKMEEDYDRFVRFEW